MENQANLMREIKTYLLYFVWISMRKLSLATSCEIVKRIYIHTVWEKNFHILILNSVLFYKKIVENNFYIE